MSTLAVKVRTALALGLMNLFQVARYRLEVKWGVHAACRLHTKAPEGNFFAAPVHLDDRSSLVPCQDWQNEFSCFGWFHAPGGGIPDWHANCLTNSLGDAPLRPWWTIPDFDKAIGDIKTVWEASRFDWVVVFAQHIVLGEQETLQRLNNWLNDWVQRNPPYSGRNWKCGQEASIRVLHLALAAQLLGQIRTASRAVQDLIKLHLQRIAPTIQYALAQDNNHGTSEAAALFVGGCWLSVLGDVEAEQWREMGRKWLEERVMRLIEEDGSFSQYSLNYHRLMLDTYSLAECWRRHLGLPPFSNGVYKRLGAAAEWLYQMVQPECGDAPNLGHNDGAWLLPLGNTGYRDYRPSVQLAMALFCGRSAYMVEGDWSLPLRWLEIPIPKKSAQPLGSRQFPHGGYSVLRCGKFFALLRYPMFRFRPAHADALHVDLWVSGQNLLRDAGTYSYSDNYGMQYYAGTAGHNTIQFDNRDQMPQLGRFLFGDWLKAEGVIPVSEEDGRISAAAGYIDRHGASHYRKLILSEQGLRVEDEVSGFNENAVLRWRLLPGDWTLDGDTIYSSAYSLRVFASVPLVDMRLINGRESRYYLQNTPVPVLEVEIRQAGRLVTEYRCLP